MSPVTNPNDYDRSNYTYHENCTSRVDYLKPKLYIMRIAIKSLSSSGCLYLLSRRLLSFYGKPYKDRK